jgi:septum formation protein
MKTHHSERPLILASSSPFRRSLLQRLQIEFDTDSPNIDETSLINESPIDYVTRLSLAKAKAVVTKHSDSLIIASDQCSVLNGVISGKPGSHEKAVQQLQDSSSNKVSFLTGLCVYDSKTGEYQLDVIPFYVYFRVLEREEIERYLLMEKPYECAGSFKAEGLGITLFKRLEGDDPTALIGLPLIRVSEMLRDFGVKLP